MMEPAKHRSKATEEAFREGAPVPNVAGVNVAPGSADDGWVEGPAILLANGTSVQLFKDGQALLAAAEAIERARQRIWLEVYIFHSDGTGLAFAELLSRKAREGLEVRLILDSFGAIGADRKMFDRMREAGVVLREFHPIAPWRAKQRWRPTIRDHRKLVIVDEDCAIMGGQNLGDEYGSSWITGKDDVQAWRDTAVGVRGPSVRLFAEAFERMWRYIERGGRIRHTEFIHSEASLAEHPELNLLAGEPRGRVRRRTRHRLSPRRSPLDLARDSIAVLASAPTPRSRLLPSLQKLFRDAERSIDLTMGYFAPPKELVDQLVESARSGVRVRLMLAGNSDVRVLMWAARAFYEELMAAGVEIHERLHAVLHAKTLCVDGRISIVGSMNLDYRSFLFNSELSVVVHSLAFGQEMHRLFEHDVSFARHIVLEEWRHRPWIDRTVQAAVQRVRYLL